MNEIVGKHGCRWSDGLGTSPKGEQCGECHPSFEDKCRLLRRKMAEYINKDTLMSMINAKADTLIEGKEAFLYVAKWLDLLPTADVVEVVRCEKCKHAYINSFSAQSGVVLCRFWANQSEGAIQTMPQDGFCSYGERSNENAE